MQYNIEIRRLLFTLLLISAILTSCVFENEENLFEQDKIKIYNYESHIKPYIENNCLRCHTISNAEGNIVYDNYKEVIKGINDGSFLGSIKYKKYISPMPPLPSPKTDEFKISIIEDWIEQGCKEKE